MRDYSVDMSHNRKETRAEWLVKEDLSILYNLVIDDD